GRSILSLQGSVFCDRGNLILSFRPQGEIYLLPPLGKGRTVSADTYDISASDTLIIHRADGTMNHQPCYVLKHTMCVILHSKIVREEQNMSETLRAGDAAPDIEAETYGGE